MQLGFEWSDLIPSPDVFSSVVKAAVVYDAQKNATRVAVAQIQADSRRRLDDRRAAELDRQSRSQQYPVPSYDVGTTSMRPLPVYRGPDRSMASAPAWLVPAGLAAAAGVLLLTMGRGRG